MPHMSVYNVCTVCVCVCLSNTHSLPICSGIFEFIFFYSLLNYQHATT